MRFRIRGGRVIDPGREFDAVADVAVADGVIAAVGRIPDGFRADREIDARDRIVSPGLIDLCVRPREPGLEPKATIASETRAAAAGGVTTFCMPPDTDPIIDTPGVVELIRRRAAASGHARVLTLGALTQGLAGTQISEMAALKEAGCVGIGNALQPVTNTLVMRRAMEYAATHDLTVFLHAEDAWLRNRGCIHEGETSMRLGIPGIPEAAETAAVARDLALIEHTGARAHFGRLTSAKSVQMVARARHDGLPVTADVGILHLHLTDADVGDFDPQCHLIPPLRSARDRAALRAGLADGAIAAVCSDHQPHEADAKLAPFPSTAPGASSIELLLPLMLALVEEGALALPAALAALTIQPARILGLEFGTLEPGRCADVCIFDPAAAWVAGPDTLMSRGHNTPFAGRRLRGRVTHTLCGGRLVHALDGAA